ncbi:hypothetical protein HII28_06690 [Planctomonas sp. JC2975]|nr:hypothetical protein [Planctomonas sp. JC2975]
MDHQFRDAVLRAARTRADALLAAEEREVRSGAHRELMRDAKVLLSLVAADRPADAGTGPSADSVLDRSGLLTVAALRVGALRALQCASGLFAGGDNLQSPPDSAFTINDACDAYAFLDGVADASAVRDAIGAIICDAAGALLTGGVHTPNHRWEISAALARIHRSFPDERLVARVDEWLAEGVDVDRDGLYSERSPNYAAHVTNPSLSAIGDSLGRPELKVELEAIVHRNLEATLALVRQDDTVETVQSRRQDQASTRFPIAPYLAAFRIAAVTTGRADFAAAARRAAASAPLDAELLAESLLRPQLLAALPEPGEPEVLGTSVPGTSVLGPSSYLLETVGLAGRRSGVVETVLYGGSDYAAHRRIRSGLANNPTFARVFAGDAVLESMRLSRSFFDLGPFRASSLRQVADDEYVLEETVNAAYYQPLGAAERKADGEYELDDDGRFSASMSFPLRPRDEVSMTTVIGARLLPDGVELQVSIAAPRLPWSLEFAFRPGGAVIGGVADGEDGWVLPSGHGGYEAGDARILLDVDGAELSATPLPYEPGQDYGFLGGTDAARGVRVRVGGTAPATFRVSIRAEQGVRR